MPRKKNRGLHVHPAADSGRNLCVRDKFGRTPIVIGHKDDAYCASFESFAYINLGYTDYKELGPGEIVYMTPESVETVSPPREEMKICSFLWVYYGYPHPATRASMWRACAMSAESCWQRGMRRSPKWLRAFPTQASHTPSGMPMNPAFHLPVPLSSTLPPGPGPSCPRIRARET